jgi:hypothetical protein
VSLAEKPEPDAWTVDPAEPETGLRDIEGTVTGSVELALMTVAVLTEVTRLVVVDETDEELDVVDWVELVAVENVLDGWVKFAVVVDEVMLLCVELEAELTVVLVDVVFSSTGAKLAPFRPFIGLRAWAATCVSTSKLPKTEKATTRRRHTENRRWIFRNYVRLRYFISVKDCNYTV